MRILKFSAILSLGLYLCFGIGCASVKVDSKPIHEQKLQSAEIDAALAEIEKHPDSPAGHLRLASLYIKAARVSGDFALNRNAVQAVDAALAIAPKDLASRKLKLSLLATFHRFDEARAMADALLQEFPNESYIYGILTDANVELGNYDEAVAAAQKMVDLKPNSSSYSRIGHIRSLHGNHAGAVEMMTLAARTADPMDKEAQSWCLVMLGREHFKNGDYSKAQSVLDEALTILPDYPLALVEKARVLAHNADFEAAENCLTGGKTGVLSPEAIILRGDIASRQGDAERADVEYRRAESVIRDEDADMHRLALLWADHDLRLDEALDVAEKDFETNKDIYAADIYAWCLYKKERFQEAKDVIDHALRLETGDARILYHAGMIAHALGDNKKAANYLNFVAKTNPAFDLLQAEKARVALLSLS